MNDNDRATIDAFHRLYYDSEIWQKANWLGVPVRKCPLDLWIYQEIFHRVKPDLIIECGTYGGGSALYFASLCDLLGRGRVMTVEIAPPAGLPSHSRIEYLTGSSTSPEIAQRIRDAIRPKQAVLAILDSAHQASHVLDEMKIYAPMITVGSYLVVEDGNINGHPALPGYGPGPWEAIHDFLAGPDGTSFEIDRDCEKFLMTCNPCGYLRRIA
jgi:cephalosporin hydroxylase